MNDNELPVDDEGNPASDSANLVSRYLALVDEFGSRHARVAQFLVEHGDNSEIKEWSRIVGELDEKGGSARVQRTSRRLVRGIAIGAVSLVAVFGVYASIGLRQTQDKNKTIGEELRLTRDNLEKSEVTVAVMDEKVRRQDSELKLYVNAKETIDTLRAEKANVTKSLTAANIALTKAQNDLKEALVAQKEAVNAVAESRQQLRKVTMDLATAAEAVKKKDDQLTALQSKVEAVAVERDQNKKLLDKEKEQTARLVTATGELEAKLRTVSTERDQNKSLLAEANREIARIKSMANSANPARTAVLIAATSQMASHRVYLPVLPAEIAGRLPKATAGDSGSHYARAMLYQLMNNNERQYIEEMKFITREDSWRDLVEAELNAKRIDPQPFVVWLGGLEKQLTENFAKDPDATSMLLTKRAAGLQACVRVFDNERLPQVFGRLLELAKMERAAENRAAAVETLVVLATELGIEKKLKQTFADELVAMRRDDSSMLRWHVAHALRRLSGTTLVSDREWVDRIGGALAELAKDRDPSVAVQARHGLQILGHR
ncbi:MAG TPA: hypothetical protein VHR66_31590 [Gemmataceae bacterium]|jgi:hypothetical protein|nr:hypothetical protein [Gemmataceae bacterium]